MKVKNCSFLKENVYQKHLNAINFKLMFIIIIKILKKSIEIQYFRK